MNMLEASNSYILEQIAELAQLRAKCADLENLIFAESQAKQELQEKLQAERDSLHAESEAKNARIQLPELSEGEHYAGLILAADGQPLHHVVLLPGDIEATWDEAIKWAEEMGGELPTRREQSLLFANAKQHFELDWYWSSEQHAASTGYAQLQGFRNGGQGINRKSVEVRARAIRRVPV